MTKCKGEGCSKGASFNEEGMTAKYCKTCAKKTGLDMVNIGSSKKTKCLGLGCSKLPTFNIDNSDDKVYCKDHVPDGAIMYDPTHPTCQYKDGYCNERAYYNMKGTTTPMYCKEHVSEDMINLSVKRCAKKDCYKTALFNFLGESSKFCLDHKEDGMNDMSHIMCKSKDCNTRAGYNIPSIKTPKFCFDHQENNMIDVVHPRCNSEKCMLRPSCNYKGIKTPIYCAKHKIDGMTDVVTKRCEHPECDTMATFNFEGETMPTRCINHIVDGMVDIKHPKCESDECKNRAIYGLKNKVTHCHEHKTNDMKVQSSECDIYSCRGKAIYTTSFNEKPTLCEKHASATMFNVNKRYDCSVSDCDEEFLFTYKKKNYCEKHCPDKKLTNSRFCKYCEMSPSSIFICIECRRNCHPKEASIVKFLSNNIYQEAFLDSSSRLNGCSKRRPDILYECNTHNVIIEIDENQHNGYDESCECSRLNEIFLGLENVSLTVIRFNFDKVKHKNKVIKFDKDARHELLLKTIKTELDNIPTSDTPKVNLIQLFYNDDEKVYQPYKELDITKIVTGDILLKK